MNEDIVFNKLINRNPLKGKKYSENEYKRVEGKAKIYYKVFSWMIEEDQDIWISCKTIKQFLRKYNITIQLYYDIVVLGLISIEDRPRCETCHGKVKFYNMYDGYQRFCCKSCMDIGLKGREISKDTRDKMSKSHIGLKSSPEAKKKIGEANKRRVFTPEIRKNMSIGTLKRITDPKKHFKTTNRFTTKGFKSGIIKSVKAGNIDIKYLSSWEKTFIQNCDKDSNIIKLETPDPIEYKKDDGTVHNYLPDFKLTLDTGIVVIVEIKPNNLVKKSRIVLLKRIAAKKYCRKNSYKYIILTENELFNNIHGSFNIYDFVV